MLCSVASMRCGGTSAPSGRQSYRLYSAAAQTDTARSEKSSSKASAKKIASNAHYLQASVAGIYRFVLVWV
jgi:hypothetical protein